jgi:hypothetical protein
LTYQGNLRENNTVLPTHGFIQSIRCHAMHLYNSRKSAADPTQAQVVRSSVPNMFIIARRHDSGGPEQDLLTLSTEHAWS